jgi:methylated-DNA-[protein]-cysteine S-methyltransferase
MAYFDVIDSPLGPVFIGGSDEGIHRIDFLRDGRDEAHFIDRLEVDAGEPAAHDEARCHEAATQLREYFDGARESFDLPLALRGTEFQRAVWDALLGIPYGHTSTYGAVARRLGRPAASRAVGASVGRNPVAVVVPCHRVLGSSGALTGYAGGLDRKRGLLSLEINGVPMAVPA